MKYFIVHL